jgi:hypothetical protein
MLEQEHQDQSHRPRKSSKSRLPVVFVIIVLLLALAGAGFFLFTRPEGSHTRIGTGQQETKPAPVRPAPGTEKESTAKAWQSTTEEATQPGSDLAKAGGQTEQCAVLAKQLHDFFRHVDQQDYLVPFSLNKSSQVHFIDLADRLLANPPVVSREADDLYTILQNMAHFFRVIGKENIQLIKTILDRERDKIEDVAGELYLWVTAEGCQEELLPFSPPLAKVYEYAGFFLNTMGGRSYLFRRDSRSRLLVNYYAILIVDRANALGINHHGIDISQPIPQLIQEIESSTQLLNKETYLDRLYQLQETLPQQNSTAE